MNPFCTPKTGRSYLLPLPYGSKLPAKKVGVNLWTGIFRPAEPQSPWDACWITAVYTLYVCALFSKKSYNGFLHVASYKACLLVTLCVSLSDAASIAVADKFGFYAAVQRLALAVPKLSHIPHAESLATALLQVHTYIHAKLITCHM